MSARFRQACEARATSLVRVQACLAGSEWPRLRLLGTAVTGPHMTAASGARGSLWSRLCQQRPFPQRPAVPPAADCFPPGDQGRPQDRNPEPSDPSIARSLPHEGDSAKGLRTVAPPRVSNQRPFQQLRKPQLIPSEGPPQPLTPVCAQKRRRLSRNVSAGDGVI